MQVDTFFMLSVKFFPFFEPPDKPTYCVVQQGKLILRQPVSQHEC